MKHLIIINDAPYGTEKAYNGFRLALSLKRERPEDHIRVFLMADAVGCGLPGQDTPEGYYNIEKMIKGVVAKGGEILACGTCARARGMKDLTLIDGVKIQYGKITAAGGCINTAGNLTVKDSIVDSCTATSNNGGAIYTSASVTIDNSTVSNGTAGLNGGAIYTNGLTITNGAVFTNNLSTNKGGAVYSPGTNPVNVSGVWLKAVIE